MYLAHWGLSRRPFLISPDPAFLYPSDGHREALAHLSYGLEREGGFLLLTGEVGTGKTTLCRLLIDQLPAHFRLAYILNARLDSAGVLAGICRELGIHLPADADVRSCVELLHDNLLAGHGDGHQTLVIIEEAQNLDPEVLETLRLLTNLETDTAKLLHILLIGQPELLDTLARSDLRQLNQRVVSRCHLGALTVADTRAYLAHRVQVAGGRQSLFSARAATRIHRLTGGIPRLINLLAERALVGAFAEQRQQVTAAIVNRAAREVLGNPAPRSLSRAFSWRVALSVALSVIVAVVALTLLPQQEWPWTATGHNRSNTPTVFEHWLQQQDLNARARSVDEACGVVRRRGLDCLELVGVSLRSLQTLGRPVLVTLHDSNESLAFYLFQGAGAEGVRLVNSAGVHALASANFEARWRGDALLIWSPPPGFEGALHLGDYNPRLLDYVTELMRQQHYLPLSLVTGGFYSDYLVQQVRRFQSDSGLASSGVIDAATLAILESGKSIGPDSSLALEVH